MIQWLDWLIEHKAVFIPIAAVFSVAIIVGLFKFLELLGASHDWLFKKGFLKYNKSTSRAFWTAFPLIFVAIMILLAVFNWGYEKGIHTSAPDKAIHILNELYPGQDAY